MESKIESSTSEVHTIGDYQTTVGEAAYAHQEHPLDTPMDVSMVTETSLSDLNDECLETIFSLKFISITDLCAVARTNHRLMNIADRQFSLNHKTCNLRSLVKRISDARRVIVTFGYLISDLRFGERTRRCAKWWKKKTVSDWNNLLTLVIGCCSETLETLELVEISTPEYLTSELKKLFSNLQKLCINDCIFKSIGDLFADCKKLVELTVSGVISDDKTEEALNARFVMDNVFSKLERFDYKFGDYKNIAMFLSRHKNLKSLYILRCEDSFFLLPIIAINCSHHLEELKIDFKLLSDGAGKYGNAVESLQMFEHLRALHINCAAKNITKFISKLSSLKSLEYLKLCEVKADYKLTSALSQLKSLKELVLSVCAGFVNLDRLVDLNQLANLSIDSDETISLDIVLLVKRLNSLKILNIWVETYELDKKMYLNLVNVVQNRPIRSQQSLEILCYIAEDAVPDLQNVRDNRQIVKLKIENGSQGNL